MVCFTVQPQLASTRISRSVASRMVRRISRSRSLPSLILRMGYCFASSTLARIFSAVSIPMVKVDRGALAGSRPQSFQTGMPSRLPTRSCNAEERAARVAGLRRSDSSQRRSVSSMSNGSSGRSLP